jgi:release factor glutamine methyltransferase
MQYDQPLTDAERDTLREVILRRLQGEPLQYISGRAAFRHLELAVRPGVLIPRPETETLVELVLAELKPAKPMQAGLEQAASSAMVEQGQTEQGQDNQPLTDLPLADLKPADNPQKVLEIGCGSGAIALSLVYELPGLSVWATDISSEAVALTRENAERLGLSDLEPADQPGRLTDQPGRLTVIQDDLASSLVDDPQQQASFAVVVSNPPYIPTSELADLAIEVRDFEPLIALDGGEDGLDIYTRLLEQAFLLLQPNGLLAVELYETKLQKAANLAEQAGYIDTQIHTDLTGRQRFLTARKPINV